MKLKKFTEETLPKQMGGKAKPAVRISKAGVITINRAAAELIGVKENDKVGLAQDDESAADFYLYKDDKAGFALRQGYDKNGSLLFNHRKLQQTVCDALEIEPNATHAFLLAKEPSLNGDKTKYWGLLHKSS